MSRAHRASNRPNLDLTTDQPRHDMNPADPTTAEPTTVEHTAVDPTTDATQSTPTSDGSPEGPAVRDDPERHPLAGYPEIAPDSDRAVMSGSADPRDRRWLVAVAVLVVGMFMSVLDMSIINVAIPAIQNDFGTNSQDIQWIATAYTLAMGVIVPVSGWLGDRYGLGRTYLVSLLGFSFGSILCGIAWNLQAIVAFRIIQAVPGGILPVITLVMLYRVAPKDQIGTAMGVYGLGMIVAPAIGPTLGGYLVQYQSWRLIFFINVPIGLLGAAMCYFLLPDFPRARVGRFDIWGFLTVAGGLFAILLALSKGEDWGWASYRILMLEFGAVDLLALFVVIELNVKQPLIDIRIFRTWQFTNSLLLIAALSVGLFSVVYYVPLFLEEGQGLSPFYAGLMMFPEAAGMAAIMPAAGQLYDKLGPRIPAVLGLALNAYGTYLLTGINADVSPREIVFWTWLRAVGNGLCLMAVMTAGLEVVPEEKVNEASAINNVVQRLSAAFGLAILTSLASTHQEQNMQDRSSLIRGSGATANPHITQALHLYGNKALLPLWHQLHVQVLAQAYSDVFLVISIITGIGALLALLLKNPAHDPADAQSPPHTATMTH